MAPNKTKIKSLLDKYVQYIVNQINEEICSLGDTINEIFEKAFDDGYDFDTALEKQKPYKQKLDELWTVLALKFSESENYSDYLGIDNECKMDINEFASKCCSSHFTDWDGSGYYASEDKVSNIPVVCNMFAHGIYNGKDFKYVVWYNK